MEYGNIDLNAIGLVEGTANVEMPVAPKAPAEPSNTKPAHHEARSDSDKIGSTSKPKNDALEKIVEKLNQEANSFDIEVRFSIRKDGPNHISVKIVNAETNEVIREVPPEKFSLSGSSVRNAVGMIIDEAI